MNNNKNNNKLDSIINMLSSKFGANKEDLKNDPSAKMLSKSLENLNDNDLSKVTDILSDKEKTSKILSTPKAQEMLNKLFKER